MTTEEQTLASETATEQQAEVDAQQASSAEEATAETVETDEEREKRVVEEKAQKEAIKADRQQKALDKRFAEMTAARYAETARADALARELEQVRNQKQTVQSVAKEPTREEFETYEDYVAARAEFRAEQKATALVQARIDEFQKVQKEQSSQSNQQNETQRIEREFKAARAEVEKKLPDYKEVIEDWEPTLPGSVQEMVARLPDGPLLCYHFAKNPELEAQFLNQPDSMHGILLGEIRATLKASAKETKAPSPGKPVASKAASNDGGYSGDPEGYYAWAKKNLR